MTREERQEAIAQLERISRNLASIGETVDYTEFAIEALEQEPCEDAVSRQAVINAIANTCFWLSADNWTELMKCICSLPSVIPQPKTEWVLCSERLPEIRFDLNSRTSDTVFVCLENSTIHMAFYCDDDVWRFCESGEAKEPMWDKVIAWQTLPQPYRAESEDK